MRFPDIPFEYIIPLLFFVLPVLSSLLQRGKNKQGPSQQESRRAAPQEPAQTRPVSSAPTTSASTTTASTTTASSSPNTPTASGSSGNFGGTWLEEAQRRVREAQAQETDRRQRRDPLPRSEPSQRSAERPQPSRTQPARSQPSRTQPARTQPARPQQAPTQTRPQARPPTPATRHRSLEGASLEAASVEASSLESSSLETFAPRGVQALAEAPPLRVQRLTGSKRATITKQELRFDEHELAKGLIWHQILSPPRSTLRRTRLSRRQP